MSKGLGQKIAIKFTEDLVGDVTGLVPSSAVTGDYFRPSGTTTSSSQYSSYAPSRAFDGSTSSYWYTRTTGDQWVQIELAEPTWVYGFRWYIGSNYRPNGFDFQGSNDGENWEDILTGNSPNATGWHEFPTDSPKQYKYYRWTITSRYSSYLYVYEIELLKAVGNERAFTITGKEYQYVNSPLVDKEYQVEKVERYPIQRVWELGGQLQLDGPGEMSITDAQCYETTNGTTLTGTVQANAGDIVLATISHRSTFTTPAGWTMLYESPTIGSNQRMVFAIKKIDTTGQVSFTASQSISGRIYLNLISVSGISDIESANEYELSTGESAVTSVVVPNKQEGEKLIWGVSANLWVTSDYGQWSTVPDDLQLVQLPSTTQPRQLNAIDFGEGQATERQFIPNVGTGTTLVVSAVRLVQEYDTPKICTFQPIQLSGKYRIKWLENKPESTDILIEYATGQMQGQWQTVNNGEVVNIDTNLWIRVTLSTEDTTITPTLQDLWLEEPEAPADQIRLVMHPQSRFNNVEGPLTVQYDQSRGSLRGRDGPVEGFIETFTPTDLEPKPNPHVAETITVKPEIELQFLKVEYYNRFEQDTRITALPSISVEFMNVDEINP